MSAPNWPSDELAKATAPIAYKYESLANLTTLEALRPAAKERATKEAANTFASTGRNIFVHYATPVLEERRKLVLALGLSKKKYPKSAAQVFQTLDMDERFFWDEAARQLRMGMKDKTLSPKGCLVHGGRLSDRESYVWHAEVAVAAYLNLPQPQEPGELYEVNLEGKETKEKDETGQSVVDIITSDGGIDNADIQTTSTAQQDPASIQLLDTLPDAFEYDKKMLYSHFAHYDYDSIRAAEGKHRTAMLRQLADLFDHTGKILFYYYVVPRLCKQSCPPTWGETVTSKAAEVWRFLPGPEKEKWREASQGLKKRLGDGEVGGLEVLELGSLDGEVLRLHGLAKGALDGSG